MKTWKLVSGILSIIFVFVVFFQSCAAGVADALENSGGMAGTAGILTGILMLAGGIVSIVGRKGGKAYNIALIVLYGLAALTGFTMYGIYTDLLIFAGWCALCAAMAIFSLVKKI